MARSQTDIQAKHYKIPEAYFAAVNPFSLMRS
jgi:hypothetical protein